jgi:hypothetical protein
MGVVFSVILLILLKTRSESLPKQWKKAASIKKIQLSVLLLGIYLLIISLSEGVAFNLAMNGIYNHFVITINYTFNLPFLFVFLFINTQTNWKRYLYVVLYFILVIHFIWGGYYNPNSILASDTGQIIDTILFAGTFLHLTDLLINPKSDHFRFQLKISLSILIQSLLSIITFTYSIHGLDPNGVIYYINYSIAILLYSSIALAFLSEILKLRSRYSK